MESMAPTSLAAAAAAAAPADLLDVPHWSLLLNCTTHP